MKAFNGQNPISFNYVQKVLRIYQVNAFTNQIFEGNPAGVVANADGLTADQMQAIARELNNSETAFVFSPEDESHDLRVRFFTPLCEVPTCGHASISTAYIYASESAVRRTFFRQRIQIGILPLEVVDRENKQLFFMTQGQVEILPTLETTLAEQVVKALDLSDEDLIEHLPIQAVSTGHGKIIVPIKSRQRLNELLPDFSALLALSDPVGQNGFFVFAFDQSGASEVLTHARMFAPKIGINEDPVTGNGNGPLGAYLVHHNRIDLTNEFCAFVSQQGEAMKRPGLAHVEVTTSDNIPKQVRVGGECVVAFEATMKISI